jgi:hypothetical protein
VLRILPYFFHLFSEHSLSPATPDESAALTYLVAPFHCNLGGLFDFGFRDRVHFDIASI